jgi:hypothetical protein
MRTVSAMTKKQLEGLVRNVLRKTSFTDADFKQDKPGSPCKAHNKIREALRDAWVDRKGDPGADNMRVLE